MSNVFNLTRLANSRALVRGTDPGESQILSTEEWDAVDQHLTQHVAAKAFDKAATDFFKPLTDAVDKLSQLQAESLPASNPLEKLVLREATEAVEGDEGETIFLGHDAQVLRAIATDQTELLIWVNGSIEILLPDEKPGDLLSADRGVPGMEFVTFTNKDEAMDFFANMFGAADDDAATGVEIVPFTNKEEAMDFFANMFGEADTDDEATGEGDDTPNTEDVNDR